MQHSVDLLLLLDPLGFERLAPHQGPNSVFDLSSHRSTAAGAMLVVDVGRGRDAGGASASAHTTSTVLLVGHHPVVAHAHALIVHAHTLMVMCACVLSATHLRQKPLNIG